MSTSSVEALVTPSSSSASPTATDASKPPIVHTADSIWNELETIFRTIGLGPYFEEPVTHTEHALQAGYLAYLSVQEYGRVNLLHDPNDCKVVSTILPIDTPSDDGKSREWGQSELVLSDPGSVILVIASLLHDIGHIIAPADAPHMDNDGGPDVGVIDHEFIGANWLRERGFAEEVALLTESHVTAKRYLTFKTPEYLKQLASDSTRSLGFQGGPMNASEAKAFETDSVHIQWKIKMRHFDDCAKTPGAHVPPLSYYRTIVCDHIKSQHRCTSSASSAITAVLPPTA